MTGFPVRTGIRAPSRTYVHRACSGPRCGRVIDLHDMPWLTGPVFCSDRCQQESRNPVKQGENEHGHP